MESQLTINKHLTQSKCEYEKNFTTLEEKYRKLLFDQDILQENLRLSEQTVTDTKKQLNEIMKIRHDLEKSLIQCNINAQENMTRDNEALQKVQDALQIAETALLEKNEALSRERSIKEECDLLASTIGQVMEEAAQRVEKDMEQIKNQYNNRIANMNVIIENLKSSLEAQKLDTQQAEMRSKLLEDQLKTIMQTNTQLDSELHIASQTIVSMSLIY